MSDFAGLRVALSSLYAQRRGLELAGHNVANANTEGYSRQRVDMVNVGPPLVPAFWSRWQGDGGGVEVSQVLRYRDQFLEIRAALEHGANAHLTQSRNALDRLEQLFAEPGDLGLAGQFGEFWAGWDDVANNPAGAAGRIQLLERADTLATGFNEASNAITQMRLDTISELSTVVDEINATAATVAQLNQAIKNASVAGLTTNDIQDRRDLLVGKLADLVGVTIRPGEYGQVNLSIAGTQLVSEERVEELTLDTSAAPVVIRWVKDSFPASVSSGTAGGKLEVINTTLPGYQADLDAVAVQLRADVNALHSAISGALPVASRDQSASGNLQFDMSLNGGAFATVTVAGADWTAAGGAAALQASMQAAVDAAIGAGNATVAVTGAAGVPLVISITPTGTNATRVRALGANTGFSTLLGGTAVGADGIGGRRFFEGTTSADLHVSADIAGNGNAIGAGVASGGPVDGSRALEIAELATSASGPDSLYRSFIVSLGVEAQTTQRRQEIQEVSMERVDEARNGASGVSIDEEMVNMVQFQQAYAAAARFMTAIDQMLETLIRGTGVVGR
ncbi:MAG: flagellar hook-associated protein FlgK [Actinomycetota bacterium]|nr:flagellar hook-associated protein FlgK [Actinomycetota bacterium]